MTTQFYKIHLYYLQPLNFNFIMQTFSIFNHLNQNTGHRTLLQIMKGIRGNCTKKIITKIRELIRDEKKHQADQLKKELPAFTVSGLFNDSRKLSSLKTYHPFVILNIDELPKIQSQREHKLSYPNY